MKILAIEKEIEGALWSNVNDLLRDEAQHVFELYLSGTLREIYFTEKKSAVLVIEADDTNTVKMLLENFPLVKSGMIKFEIMELRPYTGFERLM